MRLELISAAVDANTRRGEVLFIHGVAHAAWAWENFLPYFTEHGFSCYAMSLRGHGGSEGRELLPVARFRDYLEDVSRVVRRFEEPPVLVGHSLGGMLIQKFLERRRVPAAVLISTPTPKMMRKAGLILIKKYPFNIVRFAVTGNPDHIYKDRRLVKRLFFSPDSTDAALDSHLDRVTSQDESRRILLDVSFLRFRKPTTHSIPVLVIGGGQEYILGRGNFEETASLYGTAPVIFDGKAHDMMLEPGWQAVADHIIEWIASVLSGEKAPDW